MKNKIKTILREFTEENQMSFDQLEEGDFIVIKELTKLSGNCNEIVHNVIKETVDQICEVIEIAEEIGLCDYEEEFGILIKSDAITEGHSNTRHKPSSYCNQKCYWISSKYIKKFDYLGNIMGQDIEGAFDQIN